MLVQVKMDQNGLGCVRLTGEALEKHKQEWSQTRTTDKNTYIWAMYVGHACIVSTSGHMPKGLYTTTETLVH